jgi:hypothetical protein
VIGSHVLQFEHYFPIHSALLRRPVMSPLDGFSFLPLKLQTQLLLANCSLLHALFDFVIMASMEEVGPRVGLHLLLFFPLPDRPSVDLVLWRQFIVLRLILCRFLLRLARLLAQALPKVLVGIFRCLVRIFGWKRFRIGVLGVSNNSLCWLSFDWLGRLAFQVLRILQIMQLLMQFYLLRHWIGHFLSFLIFTIFHHGIIADVDDLPLELSQPLDWDFHLPVGSAVVHFEWHYLSVPGLVGHGSVLFHDH